MIYLIVSSSWSQNCCILDGHKFVQHFVSIIASSNGKFADFSQYFFSSDVWNKNPKTSVSLSFLVVCTTQLRAMSITENTTWIQSYTVIGLLVRDSKCCRPMRCKTWVPQDYKHIRYRHFMCWMRNQKMSFKEIRIQLM